MAPRTEIRLLSLIQCVVFVVPCIHADFLVAALHLDRAVYRLLGLYNLIHDPPPFAAVFRVQRIFALGIYVGQHVARLYVAFVLDCDNFSVH